uniref:Uncharacterized protein n=1 Tax=Euplotes crassus TaxID=5936 RepID=A0A7S3KPR5_EUPCR|mmetsp:Transcript_35272/g.34932  ORF Transcript_35272/g.34932 Transcript_35272/m.34932 type:complete len:109 (+) Transcript_35272:176-502(+)
MAASHDQQDEEPIQMLEREKIIAKLNMTEDTPRALPDMFLSCQAEDQGFPKGLRNQKKSKFFLSPGQKVNPAGNKKNWKEKCKVHQQMASPKILQSMRPRSAESPHQS